MAKKKTKTSAARSKQQSAGETILGFKAGGVAGRILAALKDGKPHTFAEILKKAQPKSEKQTRGFTMRYLANHGKKTGMFQLIIDGKQPDETYRLVLTPITKKTKKAA